MTTAADTTIPYLRKMCEEDLPAVLQNEQNSYAYPWTESIFRDCLRACRAGYICLLALAKEKPIGHAVFQLAAGEAHILNICITPAHRNMGHARALLNHLYQIMRELAINTVFLEVRPSNSAALRLYHSEGFNEIGVRKNYYRALHEQRSNGSTTTDREDALVLARSCTWQ